MFTIEQRAERDETRKHIARVSSLVSKCIKELLNRAEDHDSSKLDSPEMEIFAEYTPKLRSLTFGSEEYKDCLKEMNIAIEHHYANNRHHPEHFRDGINDMNLIDILEMLCDCKAASERQDNGNIRTSLEKIATRFGIEPQLQRILENTVELLFSK